MKDNKEIIVLIIVIFLLLGFAYGPLKEQGARKDATKSRGESSKSSAIGSETRGIHEADTLQSIKDIQSEIKNVEKALEKSQEESRRSPYFGKIRMSNISGRNNEDPNKEYIKLSTNLEKGEKVRITGWYLKSEVTNFFVPIGRASLLPFPFTRTESDIVLADNDKVVLTKGFSPIGVSFRTNKCTGYFEENRTFYPSLPKQCPRPIDDKLPSFSTIEDREDECLRLIKRVPRCTTRGNEYARDLPDTVTRSCKTHLTTQINYNSCVAKHFGDTDFSGHEYRVYLNKFGPLWRKEKDKINLHDQNGLVVDTISYD